MAMALASCAPAVSGRSITASGSIASRKKRFHCMASTAEVSSWEELSEKVSRLPGYNAVAAAARLPNVQQRDFGDTSIAQVVFYRDNSSWCPYCQRVWLQLEEKRIPYKVEKINMNCYGPKPAWYLEKVPSGLLPALELKGQLLTESLDIMLILEEAFPERHPLLPPKGSPKANAVDGLLRLERLLAGAWLSRLRSFWTKPGQFEGAMDDVDGALAKFGGPFFLGDTFSLVDAVYAPFLERIAASMPYWQGVMIRGETRWPHLQAWFDAMDAKPSYQAVKSDDYTITHTLEPQIGACRALPAGEAYRAKVDGKDGSWDLPLKAEVTAWGREEGNGNKAEAAQTLVDNNAAVVGFALRALNSDEKYRESVDLGFRCVAQALVDGVESAAPPAVPQHFSREVAKAAAYLRDKVGVPRDLSYPAARQLRAHLHWLVKALGSELYQ
ncbi:uncharacterized protein LOC9629978 [Selaginella moellendorffii]|nr:uncharacterized protein LOC9629978 [Selaginella moellendorffii]|eukprot:XP_002989894.2 uncharacterized protein LOC9629978 [Selaginella moellendorffii]